MEFMLIAEVYQARLQTFNRKLLLNKKMTVSEFINSNKDMVNGIAKGVSKDYSLDLKDHMTALAMKHGMLLYLQGEGVLNGTIPSKERPTK